MSTPIESSAGFSGKKILTASLSSLYPMYWKNAPRNLKPVTYYHENLSEKGIFIPRLITGVGPYYPNLQVVHDFYWFDERDGGINGGKRAELVIDGEPQNKKIDYLIRFGQNVVAATRQLSHVNKSFQFPLSNSEKYYLIQFIEGQRELHEVYINMISYLLGNIFIDINPVQLNQLHCRDYHDF